MIRGSRQLLKLLALFFALAMVAAACGSDDGETATDTATGDSTGDSTDDTTDEDTDDAMEGGDITGDIFISGSSTVEPISVRVAELFEDVQPGISVDVEGPGTGDGFAKFCAGETDISDASRQIKDSEAADCAAAGIEFTEIKVGIDGIAVMTNTNNSAVDCVTFENLFNLIGPNGEGTSTWAEADSSLPDAALDIFGPGAESGTYDSFIEIVLEDLAEEAGVDATTRTDYNPSAEDNIILQGIQSSDTSLGWVGFAFAANADVKLLQVDGGDGCVEANADTIASNEYPIARDLWIYVNNAKAEESEALRAFVDYYVSDAGLQTAVAEVGYVPLTADSAAAAVAGWEARDGGDVVPASDEPAVAALPGVTGQLVARSKQSGGWLIACTFPGEDTPGVIASVVAESGFDIGRWAVNHVEPPPDIPLPFAVVMDGSRQKDMLVNFDGERIREAGGGEAALLGSPTTSSPVRLLKVCHAYAGNNDNPADLKDLEERMSFETYMAKAALMAERLRVDAQDTVQGDPQGALWSNAQDTVRDDVQDTIRDDD